MLRALARARAEASAGPRDSVGLFTFWLLGSVRAHWPSAQVANPSGEVEMFNSGIAIVTPITNALEVIYGEELTAERKRIKRDVASRNAPVDDSLFVPSDQTVDSGEVG